MIWNWDKRIAAVLVSIILTNLALALRSERLPLQESQCLLASRCCTAWGKRRFDLEPPQIEMNPQTGSVYEHLTFSCTLSPIPGILPLSVSLIAGESTIIALLFVGLQNKWRGARQFRLWHILWAQVYGV